MQVLPSCPVPVAQETWSKPQMHKYQRLQDLALKHPAVWPEQVTPWHWKPGTQLVLSAAGQGSGGEEQCFLSRAFPSRWQEALGTSAGSVAQSPHGKRPSRSLQREAHGLIFLFVPETVHLQFAARAWLGKTGVFGGLNHLWCW